MVFTVLINEIYVPGIVLYAIQLFKTFNALQRLSIKYHKQISCEEQKKFTTNQNYLIL